MSDSAEARAGPYSTVRPLRVPSQALVHNFGRDLVLNVKLRLIDLFSALNRCSLNSSVPLVSHNSWFKTNIGCLIFKRIFFAGIAGYHFYDVLLYVQSVFFELLLQDRRAVIRYADSASTWQVYLRIIH
mgnify:CR=1 FL=1